MVDHGIDGFLELQNFAAYIDGNFFGKIAIGHRNRHVGNIAHLRGQITGHLIDRIGERFPYARYALHLCLATQLALSADLTRHAGHFRSEHREPLDHGIHHLRGTQELAFEHAPVHFQFHRLPEVALGHSTDSTRDFRRGAHHIFDESINRLHLESPFAHRSEERHPLFEPAFFADRNAQLLHFLSDVSFLGDGTIKCDGDLSESARPVRRQPYRKIAIAKCHHCPKHHLRTEFRNFNFFVRICHKNTCRFQLGCLVLFRHGNGWGYLGRCGFFGSGWSRCFLHSST